MKTVTITVDEYESLKDAAKQLDDLMEKISEVTEDMSKDLTDVGEVVLTELNMWP